MFLFCSVLNRTRIDRHHFQRLLCESRTSFRFFEILNISKFCLQTYFLPQFQAISNVSQRHNFVHFKFIVNQQSSICSVIFFFSSWLVQSETSNTWEHSAFFFLHIFGGTRQLFCVSNCEFDCEQTRERSLSVWKVKFQYTLDGRRILKRKTKSNKEIECGKKYKKLGIWLSDFVYISFTKTKQTNEFWWVSECSFHISLKYPSKFNEFHVKIQFKKLPKTNNRLQRKRKPTNPTKNERFHWFLFCLLFQQQNNHNHSECLWINATEQKLNEQVYLSNALDDQYLKL